LTQSQLINKEPGLDKVAMAFLGFGALALLTCLGSAWYYFLPLPIFDYWDVLYTSAALEDKGFGAHCKFYWQSFVDQKIVFPKIVIDRLIQGTDNNHYGIEIVLGFLAQGAIACLCYKMAWREGQRSKNSLRLGAALGLFFWPYLSFRFQHHWYSTQYSCVLVPGLLAVYLMTRYPGRSGALAWAVLLTVVSGLSHGTGLFLTFALVLALAWQKQWSWTQRSVAVAVIVSFLVLMVRELPDRGALGFPPLFESLKQPRQFLFYFVNCFGPKVHHGWAAAFIIALAIGSAARLQWQRRLLDSEQQPWNLIILWTLLVAGGTALTRSSMGGSPQRFYFSFFILFWYAAFNLLLNSGLLNGPKKRCPRLLFMAAVGYFFIIYGAGVEKGLRHVRGRSRAMDKLIPRLAFASACKGQELALIFPHSRIHQLIFPTLDKGGLLAKFIKLEPLAWVNNIPLIADQHKNEISGRLSRPLKRNEILKTQGPSCQSLVILWKTGAGWLVDADAGLTDKIAGQFYFRPSSAELMQATAFRIVDSKRGGKVDGRTVSRWRRRDRPGR
jgi:hypothetical protein